VNLTGLRNPVTVVLIITVIPWGAKIPHGMLK
jgi:hypothetical protein